MTRAVAIVFTAALACAPSVGWCETAMITASKDNTIFANNLDASNGGGAGIFVGSSGPTQGNSPRRGLLQFDIASGLPAGATITAVSLTMYLGQAPQSGGEQTINLHRLTVDWGEGTAGSHTTSISGTGMGPPAANGDATWNERHYQQTNWTSAGAAGDFVLTASASASIGVTVDTDYHWSSTPTLVSDVQTWLDSPSSNFGWILINTGESTGQSVKAFYSRDAVEENTSGNELDPTWRPTLAISFLPPPTGDYNANGFVDAADYVLWRKTFGLSAMPPGSGADGNKSGTIDPGDYTYWRDRFGNPASGFAAGAYVPEPAGVTTCLFVAMLAYWRRRR